MDWAEKLERMYTRWAEKQGFKVVTLDRSPGQHGLSKVEFFLHSVRCHAELQSYYRGIFTYHLLACKQQHGK